ncbi:MAG: HAMP domain-containing protein [Pseudomonadales bacterium]|nr:HAMP domain-containing protein [Pseudomonadales bacterium]
MDIRTKLALALVSVALLGMALLGAFAYKTSSSLLQEISIRQLDALAESKKRDLVKVQEGWRDQLRLIKSRTQLRAQLKDYLTTGNPQSIAAVVRIIEDAATAVDEVDQIRILSLERKVLASYGRVAADYDTVLPQDDADVAYGDTFPNTTGGARVVFTSWLTMNGERIGIIEAVFDAGELRSVTDDYTGLGETGEAMVLMKEDADTILVLNPLRHREGRELTRIPLSEATEAMKQALEPNKEHVAVHAVDYRGVDVWAATRYLPELRWGLIVKVDEAEEELRAKRLRDSLFDIAIALSAFAVVGGTLLGLYLAKPIHELARLVERIRHGESHLRADASGDDEIAYLAESLNELMDQWERDHPSSGKNDSHG